jgi:hypothetical protein
MAHALRPDNPLNASCSELFVEHRPVEYSGQTGARPGCRYNSVARRNFRRASGDMAAPDVDHRRGMKGFPAGQKIPLDLIVCSGSSSLFVVSFVARRGYWRAMPFGPIFLGAAEATGGTNLAAHRLSNLL